MYRDQVRLREGSEAAANYVNLTFIARRWGISLATVMKSHIGPGKLPTRRHGRAQVVKLDDLNRYEARLRVALRERRREQLAHIDGFLAALDKPLMPVTGS